MAELFPQFDRRLAEELSRKFGLDTLADSKGLSTGYQSILKLVCGIAGNAPVLLLDEPVLGLDANNRELFYRVLMENFSVSPRLIIFSTHLIEEAAMLIDEAVILKAGRVVLTGGTEELANSAYSVSGPAGAVDAFAAGRAVLGCDTLGGLKTVYLRGKPDPRALPPGLESAGIGLQKLFIELTKSIKEVRSMNCKPVVRYLLNANLRFFRKVYAFVYGFTALACILSLIRPDMRSNINGLDTGPMICIFIAASIAVRGALRVVFAWWVGLGARPLADAAFHLLFCAALAYALSLSLRRLEIRD